ncbi:hypothetical protein ACVWZK_008322 [Bradyrhizobium sp. GM0.4]
MRRSIELVLSGGKFQSVAEPLRGPELNEPGVSADVRLAGEHEKKWAKVVHDLRICIVSPQLDLHRAGTDESRVDEQPNRLVAQLWLLA